MGQGRENRGGELAKMRARLAASGPRYWRSLEELSQTAEFQQMMHREFPPGASEWWDGLNRRNFLKMAAASLALGGMSACTKQPTQQIFPYIKQPAELVLGEPLIYATSMSLGGFATGVLVKSREGHPIKVEGNPDHPASLGGSSIWMQASILDLYDPDRSQGATNHGDISTYSLFLSDLNDLVKEQEITQGAGLRFLTETVTSPTLAWQLNELLRRFPKAKWHQYEPINRDNVREGARLTFGEIVETHYQFEKASVIVALDSDFLYAHPERLRYTRQFAKGRRLAGGDAGAPRMSRLYVAESSPTVTGTMADHRLPLESARVEQLLRQLIEELSKSSANTSSLSSLESLPSFWLSNTVRDLNNHRGASIILAGECQPPIVHALVHLLNQTLGNVGQTIHYTESAEAHPVQQLASLQELVADMKSGAVDSLFILGGNPVYTAPTDVEFGRALSQVKRTIHLGFELDETAALCTWHIPQAHYLESWSDARSFDGTISLVQPLIAPLYGGKSAHEILGAMSQQQPIRSDYEIVREFWRTQNLWPDFEKGWRKALHDGLIEGTALKPKQVEAKFQISNSKSQIDPLTPALSPSDGEREEPQQRRSRIEVEQVANPKAQKGGADFLSGPRTLKALSGDIEVSFRPDPSVWDGQFANNGWLQECPRPVSKLTWDNAIFVSPALAELGGFMTGNIVELSLGDRSVRGPIWIMPGQAQHSVTVHLGYGRRRVGRVGTSVGFNAYDLRSSESFWFGTGARITPLGEDHLLVSTQTHHAIDSPERQVYRSGTLAEYLVNTALVKKSIEAPEPKETLYEPDQYKYTGYKWGMSINLTSCIGCNACLVACEAENNIPVVGKDQVRRHREMFWIRVDTYYEGSLDNPTFNHMPVPCMQCEHAPCELVCPVAATVHDHEGLNVQIYNRCVGTRFCSNNCPYKVRRFNFLRYTDYDTPNYKPMYNPEVTVRWRGVMEKCTYCIQRISAGRIAAEKENRRIREGEVTTACQQACPAEAIAFGDLNAPESKIARLKSHALDYSMLGQLNTRPRTTYLAKITNPRA